MTEQPHIIALSACSPHERAADGDPDSSRVQQQKTNSRSDGSESTQQQFPSGYVVRASTAWTVMVLSRQVMSPTDTLCLSRVRPNLCWTMKSGSEPVPAKVHPAHSVTCGEEGGVRGKGRRVTARLAQEKLAVLTAAAARAGAAGEQAPPPQATRWRRR